MVEREKERERLIEDLNLLRQSLSDAEGARLQSEEALRDSEERFRSLMDGILDAVLILDWDGTILFANRAAAISVTRMGAQSSAPYRKELQ